MYYKDTEAKDLTQIVKYYFVLAEIWFDEELDGEENPEVDGKEVPTFVFLQVPTDNLETVSDADKDEFRNYISERIPYYHYFKSLAEPLDSDFIQQARYDSLIYDSEKDRYELKRYESVFVNRFKPVER